MRYRHRAHLKKIRTYCSSYWAAIIKALAAPTTEERREEGIEYLTPRVPPRKQPFHCSPPRTYLLQLERHSPPHGRSVEWVVCCQSGRWKSASRRAIVLPILRKWGTGAEAFHGDEEIVLMQKCSKLRFDTDPLLLLKWDLPRAK